MNKTILSIVVMLMAYYNHTYAETTITYTATQFQDTTSTQSTAVFSATEMSCKTDSKLVEKALFRTKGVKKVLISGESITVTFNPQKVSTATLKSVIENTGTCEDPNAKVHKVEILKQQ